MKIPSLRNLFKEDDKSEADPAETSSETRLDKPAGENCGYWIKKFTEFILDQSGSEDKGPAEGKQFKSRLEFHFLYLPV